MQATATHLSEDTGKRAGNGFRSDVIVALLFGLMLYLLVSSGPDIPSGYDAYRHVKLAIRMTQDLGSAMQDPWRLAYLWPKPVDVWFGFHLMLAPLTMLFEPVVAAKLLGALLFAGTALVLLRLLAHFHVPYRVAWLALATAGSSITLHRACVSRPFILAILLVLLVTLLTLKQQPVYAAIASAVHALSYSMFFLVAFGPGLWFLLRRDRQSLRNLIFCLAGVAAGLLANPYFPENLRFDLVVAGVVRVAAQAQIEIGTELHPIRPGWFYLASLPVGTLWLAAAAARFRELKQTGLDANRDLFFLGSIVALAGSFQVGRTFDLFVPFAAVFSAFMLSPWITRRPKDVPYFATALVVFCGINVLQAYHAAQSAISYGRYRPAAEYLRRHAPGELVVNAQWGDYYYLYFWNDANRYFIGMEPTLTYLMDSKKYWLWRHISDDEVSTCEREQCAAAERVDIAAALAKGIGARYILTHHAHQPNVEKALDSSPGVTPVFRDAAFTIYRIAQ